MLIDFVVVIVVVLLFSSLGTPLLGDGDVATRTHTLGLCTHLGGGGQAFYAFPLRITCKTGEGEGVQVVCKNAYVINGRPLTNIQEYIIGCSLSSCVTL